MNLNTLIVLLQAFALCTTINCWSMSNSNYEALHKIIIDKNIDDRFNTFKNMYNPQEIKGKETTNLLMTIVCQNKSMTDDHLKIIDFLEAKKIDPNEPFAAKAISCLRGSNRAGYLFDVLKKLFAKKANANTPTQLLAKSFTPLQLVTTANGNIITDVNTLFIIINLLAENGAESKDSMPLEWIIKNIDYKANINSLTKENKPLPLKIFKKFVDNGVDLMAISTAIVQTYQPGISMQAKEFLQQAFQYIIERGALINTPSTLPHDLKNIYDSATDPVLALIHLQTTLSSLEQQLTV